MQDETREGYKDETIAVSTDPMDIAQQLLTIGVQTKSLNTGSSASFLSHLAVLIGIIIAKEGDGETMYSYFTQVRDTIKKTIVEMCGSTEHTLAVHILTCGCDTCKEQVQALATIVALKKVMEMKEEVTEEQEGETDLKDWDPCQQKPN